MDSVEGFHSDEVRRALEHLYEDVALAQTTLASRLPSVAVLQEVPARARFLRSVLLGGIELLLPARQQRFGSRASRSHDILSLRYVEGMTVAGIAVELGISERQAYRDLARALDELTWLLGTYDSAAPPARGPAKTELAESPGNQLDEELLRLLTRPKSLSPAQLLSAAVDAVAALAERLNARIEVDVAQDLPHISADEGVLKLMLIQSLSLALQSSSCVRVTLDRATDRSLLALRLRFRSDRKPPQDGLLESLQRLAAAQHLHWQLDASGDETVLSLSLRAVEPRIVLVVEDNTGAIELYRRFLSHTDGWQVMAATDARVTYDMAYHLQPAIIVLDIMMPGQDGWTILQRLRAEPATADIPVVICSVFDDPELAGALGANAYLQKPISQFELLAVLERYARP